MAGQDTCVGRLFDAHHLAVAGSDVMVAYLLEVTRAVQNEPR